MSIPAPVMSPSSYKLASQCNRHPAAFSFLDATAHMHIRGEHTMQWIMGQAICVLTQEENLEPPSQKSHQSSLSPRIRHAASCKRSFFLSSTLKLNSNINFPHALAALCNTSWQPPPVEESALTFATVLAVQWQRTSTKTHKGFIFRYSQV